ncbi:GGDEF domain-containing protein [Shewanella pealeana]|uniref:diguanylate cyclase n=1 Tax=Shewanella pealeana (strain ATCC 700345 / ANG-SQ1) TaxID=398579 RepID=A8H0I8_SHEPA|nr:membrane-associated sensor domain-containing protein [Shewanella pealeana]ABV86075.1 diguanylate cyclase [Shewanella pealeana ATCC 700345]
MDPVLKSHQYKAQLKRETFIIIKRGTIWATYISCVLAFVVLISRYNFIGDNVEFIELHSKFAPLMTVIISGLAWLKYRTLFLVTMSQTYFYLVLLIMSWCYVLISFALKVGHSMPGLGSLSHVLVFVFSLALFPNRNVMILGILPFLVFSVVYHSFHYPSALIYSIPKILCFLGILISGQKIISGWFFKAVTRSIENKKLLQQFKRLALIDGLTNISNRRHFDDVLTQEIKASLRTLQPLSIIMVDVDFFKPLNDSLGHQVGDKHLTKIAAVLNSALERPRDLVARYGGEEFVIALPDTDLSGAIRVAEKIKLAISDAELHHPSSKVSGYVTVSQGVAQWQEGMVPAQLLEMTDKLLYQAKSSGRDRYCSEHQAL